jgi:hypothetical protein
MNDDVAIPDENDRFSLIVDNVMPARTFPAIPALCTSHRSPCHLSFHLHKKVESSRKAFLFFTPYSVVESLVRIRLTPNAEHRWLLFTTFSTIQTQYTMTKNQEITSEHVSSVVLHSLDLTQDTVVKKGTATLQQIILEQKKEATIVFAARRPGCVLCREHGKQLSNLSSPKIAVLGVVKEIGVDDAGLKTFQKEYFNSWPIYLDEDLQLYKAMGNRSIFKVKTMFKLISNMRKLSRRMSQKKIEGNLVGEGTIQGGILIFDGQGNLVHVQLEDITNELQMTEMAMILEKIVGEDGSRGIPAETAPPRHCFNKGQVCPECT